MKDKRILIVRPSWPSQEHPYVTYLVHGLKQHFPELELFLFEKKSTRSGIDLIGEQACNRILENVSYRFKPTRNPIKYIIPTIKLLLKLSLALEFYVECRKREYSLYQAVGQLYYNHAILGRKYDLVYFFSLQAARHFCITGLFKQTPVVVSSRGQDFELDPNGFDKVLKQINHLHVLGDYLRDIAISRGFGQNKITIIPPAALPIGESIRSTKRDTSKENEILISSASRLFWTKGYIFALRAIREVVRSVRNYNIRYEIIGDGAQKDLLMIEAHRLGIERNVAFTGWLSQEEVNLRVSKSDIYLLLSIEEGFNNSVLQAQNLGVPCVVSNAGGLPENVIHGVTGIVVERYNVRKAAEAIIKLIRNNELREVMGDQAQRRVFEEFNLEKQINRYKQLLTSNLTQTK